MRIQRTSRPGFTITEMMVATALILLLMAIISQTFGAATKTFNELRVVGQMQERLRTTSTIIRKDLTTEHFSGPFIPGRSGPRLGDQRLDQAGWVPPDKGFFCIRQYSASVPEPTPPPLARFDGEGLTSTRSDSHVLHFTSHLADVPASELYCASALATTPGNAFPVPGQNVFYSRWAEIMYFLSATGDQTPANASGVSLPIYSLRRRVRLLAPETAFVINPNNNTYTWTTQQAAIHIATNPEVGFQMGPTQPPVNGQAMVRILGPDAVTNPNNRMAQPPFPQTDVNGIQTGDDVLMTDVLSFEIKLAWINNPSLNGYPSPQHAPLPSPAAPNMVTNGNSDDPYADIPQVPANPALALNPAPAFSGQRVFDTWYKHPQLADTIDWDRPQYNPTTGGNGFLTPNQGQPPLRINVRSIQIKLRVWDSKAEKARQVTIAQEL